MSATSSYPFAAAAAVAAIPLALVWLAVYRLFLHPLAKVPGPKLAALTVAHEFYYDCVKGGGGQHAFKMREMHRIYGMISPCVRINPWEVHIDGQADPAFWDVLYSNTNKLDKDSWYYGGLGTGLSMVSTIPHDLHRARRSAVASYFGSGNVRKYQAMVLQHISKLISRLDSCRQAGEVIDLANAYRCLTIDVVTSFAVPEPRLMLDTPDFGKGFNGIMRDFSKMITLQRHLRVLFPLLDIIPDSWVTYTDSTGSLSQATAWRNSFKVEAKKTVDRKGQPPAGRPSSVLDTIYAAPELSAQEKFERRIAEEAESIVGAGTETTAATMTLLTYHVLSRPEVVRRLHDEIEEAAKGSDDLLDLRTLEQLPYLQACINEALRMACPVTGRLPRFNPRAPTSYTSPDGKQSYTFPPGTVMSMSMPDLHFNPAVFPEPRTYKPERWIEASPEHKSAMMKSFVPFSRGSRGCIGLEVAKMELILTIGNIFHRFVGTISLSDTTERDVSWAYDFFAPYIPVDSKGLRVIISRLE